jgi:hypothetical protein
VQLPDLVEVVALRSIVEVSELLRVMDLTAAAVVRS